LSSLSPSTQRGRRAKPSPLRRLHRRQIQLLGWVYSGEQTRVSSGKRLRLIASSALGSALRMVPRTFRRMACTDSGWPAM
jgi:hypothetical protein